MTCCAVHAACWRGVRCGALPMSLVRMQASEARVAFRSAADFRRRGALCKLTGRAQRSAARAVLDASRWRAEAAAEASRPLRGVDTHSRAYMAAASRAECSRAFRSALDRASSGGRRCSHFSATALGGLLFAQKVPTKRWLRWEAGRRDAMPPARMSCTSGPSARAIARAARQLLVHAWCTPCVGSALLRAARSCP